MSVIEIINKLYNTSTATREELNYLLDNLTKKDKEYLIEIVNTVVLGNQIIKQIDIGLVLSKY